MKYSTGPRIRQISRYSSDLVAITKQIAHRNRTLRDRRILLSACGSVVYLRGRRCDGKVCRTKIVKTKMNRAFDAYFDVCNCLSIYTKETLSVIDVRPKHIVISQPDS